MGKWLPSAWLKPPVHHIGVYIDPSLELSHAEHPKLSKEFEHPRWGSYVSTKMIKYGFLILIQFYAYKKKKKDFKIHRVEKNPGIKSDT